MLQEFLLNPVVLAVLLLLVLSALRLNVVFALIISSIFGGIVAGVEGINSISGFFSGISSGTHLALDAFSKGLAHGAQLAFNYAMLGAFSIAISRSGVTELLARELFKRLDKELTPGKLRMFKYLLILILTLAAISSQNLIPVHIAFIPVLIPPVRLCIPMC